MTDKQISKMQERHARELARRTESFNKHITAIQSAANTAMGALNSPTVTKKELKIAVSNLNRISSTTARLLG